MKNFTLKPEIQELNCPLFLTTYSQMNINCKTYYEKKYSKKFNAQFN